MPLFDPSHPLVQFVQRDRRYPLDAYLFVLEALSFAHESLGMGAEPSAEDVEGGSPAEGERGRRERRQGTSRRRQSEKHVSGQQLCEAARLYGLEQYGYLTPTVLARWNIFSTDDFGEIVFNMIGIGQMRKTRGDKREDFHGVYAFADAFSRDLSFVVPDAVPGGSETTR